MMRPTSDEARFDAESCFVFFRATMRSSVRNQIIRLLLICLILAIPVLTRAEGAINVRLLVRPPLIASGITVQLDGACRQPLRNVTNEVGHVWFFALPPGQYSISIFITRFGGHISTPITLSAGSVMILDVGCGTDPDFDQICIRKEKLPDSPISLTAEALDWHPEGYHLTGIFRSIPWSLAELSPHILGGSPNDIGLMIDGMNLSDPAGRFWVPGYSVQAFDEVLVHGVALPAGKTWDRTSLLEITTRQPDQRLHFFARFNQSHREPVKITGQSRMIEGGDAIEPEVTMDGPVGSERIWFMGSFRGLAHALNLPDVVYPGDNWDGTDPSIAGNALTGQLIFRIMDEHRLRVMYGVEGYEYRDIAPNDRSSPDSTSRILIERPFGLVRWSWRISNRWNVQALLGQLVYRDTITPQHKNRDDLRFAPFEDTDIHRFYNNSPQWSEDERRRLAASLKADYSIDDLAGVHRMTMGLGWQRDRQRIDQTYAGGAIFRLGDGNVTRDHFLITDPCRFKGDFINAFFEDKWYLLEHVELEVAVQYDRSVFYDNHNDSTYPGWTWDAFRAQDYLDETGAFRWSSQMKFDTMWAPHVGFKWDIFKDNCAVITSSFSRYYDPLDLTFPRDVALRSESDQVHETYIGPEWTDQNADGVPDEDYFFHDSNWRTSPGTEESIPLLLDTKLEPVSTDEVALEYRHDWKNGVRLSTGMVFRETSRVIEDVGLYADSDGNIIWTYLGGVNETLDDLDPDKRYDIPAGEYAQRFRFVTNLRGSQRRYYGFHVVGSYENHRVMLQGGYVLSNTVGNVTGIQSGTDNPAYLTDAFDSYELSQKRWGDLPWSAHHHLSASAWILAISKGWYQCRLGTAGYWRSGFRWTDTRSDSENPFGSFPEGRGNRQLKSVMNLDLSLRNHFELGPSSRLGSITVQLDVMNAMNDHTYREAIDENALFESDSGETVQGYGRWYRLGVSYSF